MHTEFGFLHEWSLYGLQTSSNIIQRVKYTSLWRINDGLRKCDTQVLRINTSPECGQPKIYTYLGLVHAFQFSAGGQFPIIAGQNSGTQESIALLTQTSRDVGRGFTGRLPVTSQSSPLLWLVRRPVAESAMVQVLPTERFTHTGFTERFTHTGFSRLYPSDHLPLRCQITDTA
jgi:hypothetical protein